LASYKVAKRDRAVTAGNEPTTDEVTLAARSATGPRPIKPSAHRSQTASGRVYAVIRDHC
jgi:hypothetical protein